MDPRPSRICVRGLRIETRINDVFEIFQDCGTITECRLLVGPKPFYRNESKGICLISYSNPSEAYTAIQSMNGKRFDGAFLTISYANDNIDPGMQDPEISDEPLPPSQPEDRPMPSTTNWERHYIHDYRISLESNQYQRPNGYPRRSSPMSPPQYPSDNSYYDQFSPQQSTNFDPNRSDFSMNGMPPPKPRPPPPFLNSYSDTNGGDFQAYDHFSPSRFQQAEFSRMNPHPAPPMKRYIEEDDDIPTYSSNQMQFRPPRNGVDYPR